VGMEEISATSEPAGPDVALTTTPAPSGGRDKPMEVGAMQLSGKLTGAANFKNLGASALELRGMLDELKLAVASTLIVNKIFDIGLSGPVQIQKLLSLV